MIYIGCGLFFIAWVNTTTMMHFGESISFKTQITYFRKALEMDSYYYE